MNSITDNNYKEWIGRFLNAETSIDEERALYAYFSRRDLPADAEKYREMFGWYASMGGESRANVRRMHPLRILPLKWWQWAGVAAIVAVLFTVGFNMRSDRAADEAYAYSGSYIIRDGQKITDLDIVLPEIEMAEREVEMRLASFDYEFDNFDERLNTSVSLDFGMNNPDVRNIVETSLKY